MNILRVNMSRLETTLSPLPEKWIYLGGRGLSAAILNEEMPPSADPLGEDAKLVMAGGPLAGAMVPSSGRISVGGKSPLTMGIKEANGGGPAAQKLDRLGIRAVVVEGAPKDQGLYVLKVSAQGITLKAADAYKGMKTYELASKLIDENGNKPAVIAIGPAGERKLKSAAVILTDVDGHASRAAARGGLGAVMGAKGLKAVVIDDKGCGQVPMVDGDRFKAVLKDYVKLVKSEFPAQMSRIGTPIIVSPLRAIGSMPALNFSDEELPGSDQLGGEHIETLVKERGGKMSGCMPGCLVRCSVVFNDAAKKHVTSSFEYETIGLMGTNLGVCDPDIVAQLDRCCDELGVDTIETGAALGVAASVGRLTFGDGQAMLDAMDQIEKGTELGTAIGNGVVSTCEVLGIDRIPAYRGQAIPAHDPRICKAAGVTYMTSPMGADHTAGMTYEDSLSSEGQVKRSFELQIACAARDSLGHCLLATPADREGWLTAMTEMINARYGTDITVEDIKQTGNQTIRDELEFNKGTEFSSTQPDMPQFVIEEALTPNRTVFDVPRDEISGIWDRLEP